MNYTDARTALETSPNVLQYVLINYHVNIVCKHILIKVGTRMAKSGKPKPVLFLKSSDFFEIPRQYNVF